MKLRFSKKRHYLPYNKKGSSKRAGKPNDDFSQVNQRI